MLDGRQEPNVDLAWDNSGSDDAKTPRGPHDGAESVVSGISSIPKQDGGGKKAKRDG